VDDDTNSSSAYLHHQHHHDDDDFYHHDGNDQQNNRLEENEAMNQRLRLAMAKIDCVELTFVNLLHQLTSPLESKMSDMRTVNHPITAAGSSSSVGGGENSITTTDESLSPSRCIEDE